MHLSHKIKLNPNNVQATYFQKAAGESGLLSIMLGGTPLLLD